MRIGFTDDRAVVLFSNDLVTDGKAESGAFAHDFGGEEWVENVTLSAGWNSRTIVLDSNNDVLRGNVSF